MKTRCLLLLAVLLSGFMADAVWSAETNLVVAPDNGSPSVSSNGSQRLGPGDRVTYRVIEDQDDARSLTITDSGDLEVPYLGLVHAAGMSTGQLSQEIKSRLEKQLYHKATVVIAVELVNKTRVSGKVYVTGQVHNKGSFDIPAGERVTVSKAILMAGGFSDFSDKKNVRLVRKTAAGTKTYKVNIVDVWEKGKLEGDLAIEADDLVVVPTRLINY